MKNFLLLTFLIISTNIYSQICGSGDIRLQSQSEVDDFSTNYPSCDCINGILTIAHISGNPTDITNLNGLVQLTKISQLIVGKNPNLTSFNGLGNINFNSVSKISITDNTSLNDISSLANAAPLSSAGDFAIKNSLDIDETDLSILNNVTNFGTGLQLNNTGIKNVDFLNSVTTIGRSLTIINNNDLLNIDGLSSLTNFSSGGGVTANLDIYNNPLLNFCNSVCDVVINNIGTATLINISNNAGYCESLPILITNCSTNGLGGIYSGDGTTPLDTEVDITGKLFFEGDINITGEITGVSDARLKTSLAVINKPSELIGKLNPISYKFKTQENSHLNLSEKLQYGLMAQELEHVLPSLVSEFKHSDGETYKSINYQGLISILIAAIQEQQKEIDLLNKKIDE